MITLGDYRQLADALFHAGTRSNSEYDYADSANHLHFYIVDKFRDSTGVLSYNVAARSLNGSGPNTHGVALKGGIVAKGRSNTPTGLGVSCVFSLTNNGTAAEGLADHFSYDIYRLSAEVDGEGWRVVLPNVLAAAAFGTSTTARVAVAAEAGAASLAVVKLTATSESDPSVFATAACPVVKS
jgi:hypothetical protein